MSLRERGAVRGVPRARGVMATERVRCFGSQAKPSTLDRERARHYLRSNFPQGLGFQEEERLTKLLAHVYEEGLVAGGAREKLVRGSKS